MFQNKQKKIPFLYLYFYEKWKNTKYGNMHSIYIICLYSTYLLFKYFASTNNLTFLLIFNLRTIYRIALNSNTQTIYPFTFSNKIKMHYFEFCLSSKHIKCRSPLFFNIFSYILLFFISVFHLISFHAHFLSCFKHINM